ncbi:MAG: hypothetical protein AAEJ59_02325 [Arenicellales bacterium]|jgi:Xaa-Pro dipeptidase|nr:hypothetical protein [Arenicellales bacterium]
MNKIYAGSRKIDPTKGAHLDDNSANEDDRVEIGPTKLALDERQVAGLTLPNLQRP